MQSVLVNAKDTNLVHKRALCHKSDGQSNAVGQEEISVPRSFIRRQQESDTNEQRSDMDQDHDDNLHLHLHHIHDNWNDGKKLSIAGELFSTVNLFPEGFLIINTLILKNWRTFLPMEENKRQLHTHNIVMNAIAMAKHMSPAPPSHQFLPKNQISKT